MKRVAPSSLPDGGAALVMRRSRGIGLAMAGPCSG